MRVPLRQGSVISDQWAVISGQWAVGSGQWAGSGIRCQGSAPLKPGPTTVLSFLQFTVGMAHTSRLPQFDYHGRLRVFITASTHAREPVLAEPAVADFVISQLLQCAHTRDVEVTGYWYPRRGSAEAE